jgi:cytochrome c oxidase subunit 3
MREPRLAEQFEDLDKQTHAARLGMWLFLGSESLLFTALFALYASYRSLYPADFTAAVARDNVAIGTTNTLILLTSSLTVALAVHAARVDRLRLAGWLLVASAVCGLAFLGLKAVEYEQHFHEGIYPGAAYRFTELPGFGARMFFTIYYSATGLHALHVIAGLVVLGILAYGCFRERYSSASHTPVELGGLYWHIVDIIWIFLWPMLYLGHR